MTFQILCPCGQKLIAQEKHIGRQKRCPTCSQILTIHRPPQSTSDAGQRASSEITTTDPGSDESPKHKLICGCGQLMLVARQWIGQLVQCPNCDSQLLVPDIDVDRKEDFDDRLYEEYTCACGESAWVSKQQRDGNGNCSKCGRAMNRRSEDSPTPTTTILNHTDQSVVQASAFNETNVVANILEMQKNRTMRFMSDLQAGRVTSVTSEAIWSEVRGQPPGTPLGEKEGCALRLCAFLGLFLVFVLFAIPVPREQLGGVVVVLIVCGILGAYGTMRYHDAKANLLRRLPRQLCDTGKTYCVTHETLPAFLQAANQALAQAKQEFNRRAFSTFFDRIELAATSIAKLEDAVAAGNDAGMKYRRLFSTPGIQHSFPALPQLDKMHDQVDATCESLLQVLDIAQTDFQFATIWEQRKIRHAVIARFSNLGEACEYISSRLAQSLR